MGLMELISKQSRKLDLFITKQGTPKRARTGGLEVPFSFRTCN